ncbi:DUF3592 domain-containing protein [Kitasatospora sp. NPDC048722]|uniref:DUF3592 domain-containing protein n=1 Tax=Kitasatospora sp. NPDC048722 TaxID=3155639 RepID=UPI0033DAB546
MRSPTDMKRAARPYDAAVIPYLVLGLIAVLSFAIGTNSVRKARILRRRGVRTTGVVVGQQHMSSAGRGGGTAPIIGFVTADGERVRITETGSGPGISLQRGSEVPVLYLPDHPHTAVVATRGQRFAATVLPFVVTAAALAMLAVVVRTGH